MCQCKTQGYLGHKRKKRKKKRTKIDVSLLVEDKTVIHQILNPLCKRYSIRVSLKSKSSF